jgi:hypothetical protein
MRENAMANDHSRKLQSAREQLVIQRRRIAEALAGGYERGESEPHLELMVQIQAAIRAIDEAILDEDRLSQEREPIAL